MIFQTRKIPAVFLQRMPVEALLRPLVSWKGMEAETSCFLIDEDTSATNFLVRDAFMQRVVSGDQEPITPFIARVRDLYKKVGISTILVAGSSGAFSCG